MTLTDRSRLAPVALVFVLGIAFGVLITLLVMPRAELPRQEIVTGTVTAVSSDGDRFGFATDEGEIRFGLADPREPSRSTTVRGCDSSSSTATAIRWWRATPIP